MKKKTKMDLFLMILPIVVGVLYAITSTIYLIQGNFAWALVWGSYALANIGLVLAANG